MRVTASLGPAWEHMKVVLFRPFDLSRWLPLGLVFFLESCMEGRGNSPLRLLNHLGTNRDGGPLRGMPATGAGDAVHAFAPPLPSFDTTTLIVLGVSVVVIALPLVALVLWLGSRGQMMAIRGVVFGASDVRADWATTRQCASSLFKFYLVLYAIGAAVVLPVVGFGIWTIVPELRAGAELEEKLPLLFGVLGLGVLFWIPVYVVALLTRSFVAPLMLKYGLTCHDAWRRFWTAGGARLGAVAGFVLLRLALASLAVVASFVAGLLTCCLGFLPVVQQTLLLPWHVFERAWSLEILASLGPAYDARVLPTQAPSFGLPAR